MAMETTQEKHWHDRCIDLELQIEAMKKQMGRLRNKDSANTQGIRRLRARVAYLQEALENVQA